MVKCTKFGTMCKKFVKAVALALDNLVDLIVTCLSHPQAANQTFLVSDGHDLSTTELVRGLARYLRSYYGGWKSKRPVIVS